MTVEEALRVLHCPPDADWPTVLQQYEEEYNRLQRLRETATSQEERQPYNEARQTLEEAYAFLQALPGFGPVAAPEPTLPAALQQALESPYVAIRVGAVQTLGQLAREASELAPLAQARLAALSRDGSAAVAQAAREALHDPRPAATAPAQPLPVPTRTGRSYRLLVVCAAVLLLGGLLFVGLQQQRAVEQLKRQVTEQERVRQAEQERVRQAKPERRQQQSSEALSTWTNALGMRFVLLPAGTFSMGSNSGDDDEKPPHRVTISQAFYLGQHEVTQRQWRAVMGATSNPSKSSQGDDFPVENVTWHEVQDFIKRLNAKEPGARYCLPTEAEWEYAARAGTTTAYSFGDDARQLGRYAWYADNAGGKTHPMGQKDPNPWGLYDMHGNVWEWVEDVYERYPAGPVTDTPCPASRADSGSERVNRGGSWGGGAGHCRSARRNSGAPGSRDGGLGFRLLRMAP